MTPQTFGEHISLQKSCCNKIVDLSFANQMASIIPVNDTSRTEVQDVVSHWNIIHATEIKLSVFQLTYLTLPNPSGTNLNFHRKYPTSSLPSRIWITLSTSWVPIRAWFRINLVIVKAQLRTATFDRVFIKLPCSFHSPLLSTCQEPVQKNSQSLVPIILLQNSTLYNSSRLVTTNPTLYWHKEGHVEQ